MIILTNATAVQFSPPSVHPGTDIVIEGTTITDVGENKHAEYSGGKVIDLEGNLVMPGLVCSHTHLYSAFARGILATIAPSPDFVSQLKHLWWRMDRAHTEETLRYAATIGALEAITCGTTAVVDHHSSQSFIRGSLNVIKQSLEQVGLRGITCFEVTDRNGLENMKLGIEENVAFSRSCNSSTSEKALVGSLIGGHAPFTLPDEALSLLGDTVEETGSGIHLHVAEDRYDASHSHAFYDKDLLVRLAEFGLLNEKSIIVHGNFLSEEEVRLLNESNGFLVHNIRSNMNNGVGYNRMLADIRNVALGTDGINSDMHEELSCAFFKHRDEHGPLGPDQFLSFLYNGNRILERTFSAQFGRLEPGYKADLVISHYSPPTPLVAENLAGHLAFGMRSKDVETVIINGEIVYENRRFPFDVGPLYRDARREAHALWQGMDSLDKQ